ncbi:UTP--glucose-1-phosphate uridylyltransferase-like isoform X2 [Octopus vulgaris]|uniref:UTP--glucose-1-phosphate uridylyltransferase n=1 Tax=Octopus vulgaris TaxID=6645 RepID=A0A9Y1GAB8_OCTVU|nr:UTP--glucose-1-phosphate uridylyltransferase [Octopus vulgaris]CAI9716928.1 UTP--glucose-1-phosphate uridylyltransferase-like isoform X2 [Octopus vulgaris]
MANTAFVKGHRRTSSDIEFKELIRRDAQLAMHKELTKLIQTAPPAQQPKVKNELDRFQLLFERYLQEAGTSLNWEKIKVLPDDAIKNYNEIQRTELTNMKNMLNKLVVLKLNGGLGTSMGCQGPKSAISVRNDLTFLDMTVQQIEYLNKSYDADVPLVLMNSFNTDEDTEKILGKYNQIKVRIYTFNQSKFPRINRESLLPIPKCTATAGSDGAPSWYPPGHGDIYESFAAAGLLEEFIQAGREYVFVSNIDNLGATVDLHILNHLINPPMGGMAPEFVMEVTDKTRADVKGGTLVDYDGKLRLLEIAQVPKEHVDEFKSVSKFKIFNTNNLWIKLNALKRVIDERTLHMEIIVNPKTLDNGINVIQLETASGAAIKSFEGAIGINVPRKRFLPVKTTSDLLLVMSNLYKMRTGALEMSPQRSFPSVPLVKLGIQFQKVKEFLQRFASIPDMLELDHLTVSGDVTFGKSVSLKGTVIIIANHGDRIDIPTGACLENKIVSGNLRILDH